MDDGMGLPASRARGERQVVERLRLALLASAVVLMVLAAAAGGLWWSRRDAAVARSTQQASKIGCPIFGAGADRGSFCGNLAEDSRRRALMFDEQRQRADDVAGLVRTAASHAGWCTSSNDPTCSRRPPSHPPTEQDVKTARLWLGRTGASAVDARLAREGDPAPVGSLLYAAQFGTVCVVGYVESVPGGAGAQRTVGLLPDGDCL
ncbi:hypothetical protein ONA91_39715 [Micromonospora sp. DR5-3]|uniref:hypothetical protein n=1 Tax=unclassified Micromonospora TaxID=2617518 RepID=UPI0011D5A609|nr:MULTISPECIES: hypothetical protein [unclassified Micromonospora]MCW3820577.1 hypothetical protein [Micromonospora sp. DR5-3]TYC09697.1 hypothetical protein FXF52_40880 [Micromonospora sp. MP36]